MGKARILIVEDESIVRMHLCSTMRALGHEVVAAVGDADAAIEAARRESPDLILMDIQLRGERSGIEAAIEIRRIVDAALIFVTAFADEQTVAATAFAGAVGYVVKPFSEPELRAVVATALGTQQRAHRLQARERSLAKLVLSDAQALILTDADGRVTFANAGAREATAWTSHDILGKPICEALRVAASEQAAFQSSCDEVISGTRSLDFRLQVAKPSPVGAIQGTLTPLFAEADSEAAMAVVFSVDGKHAVSRPHRARTGTRLLIYSHDTFGLGHLSRSINLASAMVRQFSSLSVLIVTGSAVAHRFRLPARVDYVKLPAVRKVASERYEARSLQMSDANIAEFRASLLLRTVQDFDPDALLVDHAPTGMSGELLPSLTWLKEHRPDCVRMLGLRDIIDEPESVIGKWTHETLYHLIESSYDHVFVYGMSAVYELCREYRFPVELAARTTYLNFVAEQDDLTPKESALSSGSRRPLVFVTIGGGDGAGELVLGTCLEMAERLGDERGFDITIVTGPLMDDGLMQRLRTRASALPSLQMLEFVDSTSGLMRAADMVICTGGYNTTMQAMRYGRSVLIIPRITHRKEQLIRAERLRDLGMAAAIHPEELDSNRLAHSIRDALSAGPASQLAARAILQFDGAEQLASYCAKHGVIQQGTEVTTHD